MHPAAEESRRPFDRDGKDLIAFVHPHALEFLMRAAWRKEGGRAE